MNRRKFLCAIPAVATMPALIDKLAHKPLFVSIRAETPFKPRMTILKSVTIRWRDGSRTYHEIIDAPLMTLNEINHAEFGFTVGKAESKGD